MCGKDFKRPYDLKRHTRSVHERALPLWCPVNGCHRSEAVAGEARAFFRNDTLEQHMRVHWPRGIPLDIDNADTIMPAMNYADDVIHGNGNIFYGNQPVSHGTDAVVHGEDAFISSSVAPIDYNTASVGSTVTLINGDSTFMRDSSIFMNDDSRFINDNDIFINSNSTFFSINDTVISDNSALFSDSGTFINDNNTSINTSSSIETCPTLVGFIYSDGTVTDLDGNPQSFRS